MRKINPLPFSHSHQTSVDSICQVVFGQIIWRVKPFFLHFSPQGLGNIQIQRIRRQKKQIQNSFFPMKDSFFYHLSFVYACIIQNYKCFLAYLKRAFLQKIIRLFREKTNIFVRKLPSVGCIASLHT